MTASIDETSSSPLPPPGARQHAVPTWGADVTDLDKVRADRLTTAQQRRAAARTRDLTALLRERPDLVGVHAPADFAVEALRWCV